MYARTLFILSLIIFFFLLLYGFLNEFIAHGGPFALYSIGCIIMTAAIVGVVLGGLTFCEVKKCFWHFWFYN